MGMLYKDLRADTFRLTGLCLTRPGWPEVPPHGLCGTNAPTKRLDILNSWVPKLLIDAGSQFKGFFETIIKAESYNVRLLPQSGDS